MPEYQHILVAIDYGKHNDTIVTKAQALAQTYAARLSIVHVLDDIPMPDTSYGNAISLLDDSGYELLEAEKTKLKQFAQRFSIPDEQCWLVWGVPKEEIINLADQEHIDLLVVGSHGRHGLALLLGSTANSVVHHAQCDVLAIRLPEE